MITALLKASFLVVLSMLLFNTQSQAQSKTAQQQEDFKLTKAERLAEQGVTFEKASADLVMWEKAMANLPVQGKDFTPEQYELAKNWITQNLSAVKAQVQVLKPTSQSTTE